MAAAAGHEESVALGGRAAGARALLSDPKTLVLAAVERDWTERRFFLWLPVCAGAGVVLYFSADREPSLPLALAITLGLALGTIAARHSRRALAVMAALLAIAAGFTGATLRTASLAHPTLRRTAIMKLTGFVEEVDHRRVGARFILRIVGSPDPVPLTRVRLTTRRADPIAAGDFVALTARLVPPARAALPGGYDFARDAYFAGFDAVGSTLGRIASQPPPVEAGWGLRWHAAIDRARNALALRVSTILDGDTGAIAAAMVTGKRDLLSEDGRELIREAGIFHIITIAGVQMTLVAGLLFTLLRGGFALVPALALKHPIKKWAAAGAMIGAVAYDILTGSRIGTQRALLMTLVVFGAVLVDRRALTMRNLALAALAVIAVEPEAILGASFQLSFAAVAALVAVQEARTARARGERRSGKAARLRANLGWTGAVIERIAATLAGAGRLLFATICATSATAPFMASNFHDLSPYVAIGNPLTLTIIEFFAVPGALLGSLLYPLGLDGFVWHWVGWGIAIVLWAARLIASAPGATLHLPAFAPWSIGCFALAVASLVIWRSPVLRLTAMPFLALGLLGTTLGARYDLLIGPNGDAVAFRDVDGQLAWLGRPNTFGTAQWLAADGDGRAPEDSAAGSRVRCDPAGCVAAVLDARTLSLVVRPEAFEEDCRRADLIVTPLYAPASCGAEMIIDRGILETTGALAIVLRNGALTTEPARARGEDRPWSPAPAERRTRIRPSAAAPEADDDTIPANKM